MLLIIKITGCFFVIFSSTAIGFLAAGELIRRAEDLNAFKTVAFLIQGDIRFNRSELPEALKNISARHNSRLSTFFNNISAELEMHNGTSFDEIWRKNSDVSLKKTSFNNEDRKLFNSFGENLGLNEREAQVNAIERYISEIDIKLNELRAISAGKQKIYKTLGFLGGLFIVIILF